MTLIEQILQHNEKFVANREYEELATDRIPRQRLVIVTCMDTRLIGLLPRAMNLGQGDVKVLKTAGAIVAHPFGSIMRSILVAVYDLEAQEIAVVGHHDCGMTNLSSSKILEKARDRGISEQVLETLENSGVDLNRWLVGFEHPRDGVIQSVKVVRNHPLLPRDIKVHGLLIHPHTGQLEMVIDGYKRDGDKR